MNFYEFSKSPQKTSLRWPQGRETCSESEKEASMYTVCRSLPSGERKKPESKQKYCMTKAQKSDIFSRLGRYCVLSGSLSVVEGDEAI